jgi:hypothetical protein
MAVKHDETTLILALARGESVPAAARAAGFSERTARRRAVDPDLRLQVRQARSALLARAVGQLADATMAAVETLRELLAAEGESVRLGAARSILDAAMRGSELIDLAERVESLEAQAAASEPLGPARWRA